VFFCTDEKEKYDPTAFRDSIVQGLTEAQGDIEQVGIYCHPVHVFSCINVGFVAFSAFAFIALTLLVG